MRIKRNLFISLLVFLCGILTTAVGISFAWLSGATTEVNVEPLTGGVISQYFHCGTGSEEDPFVITKPVHLYNLTELYTLEDSFADEGYYFQLGYDLENNGTLEFYEYDDDGKIIENSYTDVLDMNYYENFRPIGSEDNPFNGIFEGSNLTINNLNISGEGVSDIGFFGYVSNSAKVQNLYINNITVDTGDAEQGHHDHSNSYVGYIAGHIDDAASFENTYVNNCEIIGDNQHIQNDWGYFGKCENAASLDAFIDKAGAGQGDDWGGSIDFKAFNQRIHDIFNNLPATFNGSFAYYQTDEMKISFGRGGKAETYLTQDPDSTRTFYLLQSDGTHYSSTSRSATTIDMPGTVMPLLANADFSAHEKNTGYIIADTRYQSSTYAPKSRMIYDSSVRSSSYEISHVGNSISDVAITNVEAFNGTGNASGLTYESENVEILTNASASYSTNNYALIKDSHNINHTVLNSYLDDFTKSDNTTPSALKLEKYDNARNSLDSILDDATLVHGLHFMDKDIAYNNTTSLNTVKLNGNVYTNYAFPKGCIDFNLKEDGKINFFGGSYYNGTSESKADCFFSLSVIERNGNNLTNNSIKKISYIYKNNAYDKTNPDSKQYIYRYSDNSYSGSQSNVGDLVFDMRYLSQTPPVQNAIYYFEIPVNKGEYALHGVSGHDAGGYLMYLDIGASGESQEETLVDDFKSVEYRSTPNKVESSILLLTYSYDTNVNFDIKVVYDDKKYYITAQSNANILLQVTVLNVVDGYRYFVNNTEILDPEIKTYEYHV